MSASPRYAMVVDVNRCVGCQTCTVACKHANETVPGVQWRRVLDVEMGRYPDVERLFLVVGCQHCAEPPCVPVCPTGATYQRPDGLVAMDYDRCIGCGYCAVACPYQARTIVHDERWYFGRPTAQERAAEHPERVAVAQKCTFCVEKIDEAQARGLTPGVDPEVTPACASACIAQAIRFGDAEDPASPVSTLLAEHASLRLNESLGTEPRIHYLYETPAVPGREAEPAELHREDPEHPLSGRPQRFWDLRAATNFTLGGFGSGLAFTSWAVASAAGLPGDLLATLQLTGGVLMALGLFAVFLEIGRKLRFPYALLRPQTSWMTREVYVVITFYGVLAAALATGAPVAHGIAAFLALGFLYCQARILHAGAGIPAWRAPLVPWLLVASGLAEGTGLVALAAGFVALPLLGAHLIAGLGLALAAVNAWLWRRYVAGAAVAGVGPPAERILAEATPWVHGIGHVLPGVLYLAALAVATPDAGLLAIAGLLTCAGGALWKVTVITRACHHQGFELSRVPRRGSGRLAAPRRGSEGAAGGAGVVGLARSAAAPVPRDA